MRKWLYLLLALVITRAFFRAHRRRTGRAHPFLERLGKAISIFVWTLCALYALTLIYWMLNPAAK